MHLFQHREQFLDPGSGLIDLFQIDMLKFPGNDEFGLIGDERLIGAEFIEVGALLRLGAGVDRFAVMEAFHLGHKGQLVLGGLLGIKKEAIDFIAPQFRIFERRIDVRNFTAVDLVGVLDDKRFPGLPENFGQLKAGHPAGGNHVL